jgi:protoporphyrinogen oxidase
MIDRASSRSGKTDVVIVGSGVTGLAAAWVLADRATVLERDARPGGLVRTERFGDYWFDRVLHLLYFQDPDTERHVRSLMGDTLAPCPPVAWCETSRGITRFPFQMNLRGLDLEARLGCIRDLAEASFRAASMPASFEEHLRSTFGRSMCEIFLFPYNRKMWKRDLSELAPSGFTWNITHPSFEEVLRGAFERDVEFKAYNSSGWYPRPPENAPRRGMECLSAALASQAHDLRCGCDVVAIHPERREVSYRRSRRIERIEYGEALLSTLPLPTLLDLSEGAPAQVRSSGARLTSNRVLSIAISVRGPRPLDPGHWRYYADESLIFTRLIFLHEFDPALAPEDGWPLLVEVTEPSEQPLADTDALVARVKVDLERAGALPEGSTILDTRVIAIDPAYVVFGLEDRPRVEAAHQYLASHGITSLGRYGKWEYSSMSSCIRDGRAWATELVSTGPRKTSVMKSI